MKSIDFIDIPLKKSNFETLDNDMQLKTHKKGKLLLTIIFMLMAQFSWASFSYQWGGSTSGQWSDANWTDEGIGNYVPGNLPGFGTNDSYGIDGADYLPDDPNPIIDGDTDLSERVDNIFMFNNSALTMSNNTFTVRDDFVMQSESDLTIGTAFTLNADNIVVCDDGSSFTINNGATVSLITGEGSITFSNNGAEGNSDPGSSDGSPTVNMTGGSLTCTQIDFDDETGDTTPQFIMSDGTVIVNTNIISTGNTIDLTISGGTITVAQDILGSGDAIDIKVSGDGTLNVDNITGDTGDVSITISGQGTVNVTGSILGNTGGLSISVNGNGTLNVDGNISGENGSVTDVSTTGNGSIVIGGNLTMDEAGDQISDSGNGTIEINGNWTNFGTNSLSGSSIEFNGGSDQTMSFANAPTFNNLTIDKTGGNVIFSSSITIANQITLTDGGLDLNNNTLNITNGSSSAISRTSGFIYSESESSNINWTIGTNTGTYLYPFGLNPSTVIPFTFDITSGGTGGAGVVSLSTYGTGTDNTPFPSGVGQVNNNENDNSVNTVDRFWIISLSSYSDNPTASITFNATAAEVGGITGLVAQRHGGTKWEEPLDGQSSSGTSVTVSGVSTFSPWALSGNNSPLPVEFLFFDASIYNEVVELDWATATEIDNDKFEIERSIDGIAFEKIGEITGNGDSNKRIDYRFNDITFSSVFSEDVYYRLKQIDYDGQFEYSEIARVNRPLEKKKLELVPNPFSTSFDLQFVATQPEMINVKVLDMNGKIYYSSKYTVGKGPNSLNISDLYNIPVGIYLVNIQGRTISYAERIFKK